jgi:hypothetical protein
MIKYICFNNIIVQSKKFKKLKISILLVLSELNLGTYSEHPNTELVWISNGQFWMVKGIQIPPFKNWTNLSSFARLDHYIHKENFSIFQITV